MKLLIQTLIIVLTVFGSGQILADDSVKDELYQIWGQSQVPE